MLPVMEKGKITHQSPALSEIRSRAAQQLNRLDQSHLRFENPHSYPVGLSEHLNRLRDAMIEEARKGLEESP